MSDRHVRPAKKLANAIEGAGVSYLGGRSLCRQLYGQGFQRCERRSCDDAIGPASALSSRRSQVSCTAWEDVGGVALEVAVLQMAC